MNITIILLQLHVTLEHLYSCNRI